MNVNLHEKERLTIVANCFRAEIIIHEVIGLQARKSKEIALVGLFAALTAVGAVFSIPVGPVPFTLQLLFTLLAGAMLGSRLGALSQITYVLIGLAGLPVFSGRGAGLGHLLGTTGGFLIGFIAGAWLTGWVLERFHRGPGKPALWITALAMAAGIVVVYVFGLGWLGWHLGGLAPAVSVMVPFMFVDAVKALMGIALVQSLAIRGIRPAAGASGDSSL